MYLVKQNKFFYYLRSYGRYWLPKGHGAREQIRKLEKKLSAHQLEAVARRVEYYCQNVVARPNAAHLLKDLRNPKTPKAYYFDTYEYARFFDENLPIDFLFGDVITVPEAPSIVKSRPIHAQNQNSVLLNLDKARHFVWVKNDKPFAQKKDMLIGRGAIYQPHRYDFYEKYFGHSLCDLGAVGKVGLTKDEWLTPKISIENHLDYKFILSLQGNDVATNLKWIMSSNSIAVMPKPTVETWFMEGTLEGGKHYIELKPDYSDLESQLNFYIQNPQECLDILRNAHEYCAQFHHSVMEDLCSMKVLDRYCGE